MKVSPPSLPNDNGHDLWMKPWDGTKAPLLSDRLEKMASQREIISSERDSLVDHLCGNDAETAEYYSSIILILNHLTRWGGVIQLSIEIL